MRVLTFMIILFLLGSCQTVKKDSHKTSEIRMDNHVKDRCPNSAMETWNNCYADRMIMVPYLGKSFRGSGRYENGKENGKYSLSEISKTKHEKCTGEMVQGQWEGIVSCVDMNTDQLVSRKMYTNGKEVPEAELVKLRNELWVKTLKEQCSDIGFKNDTEAHANCVLDLMKINSQSKSSSGTGLSAQSKELLDLKIKREQQYQTDRKIEGMKELLEYGKSLTQ